MKTLKICLNVFLTIIVVFFLNPSENSAFDLSKISIPDGFRISYFAQGVSNARSISKGPPGIVFIGTRTAGKVYALVDHNGDYKADEKVTIAKDLYMPNGVAYRDGDLYVAEVNRVIKFPDIINKLKNPGEPEIVNDSFPSKKWHGWKFIRFGPDKKLYIPVGAPCNVCLQKDTRFATIMRMDADGRNTEIFAKGVRNSVGFDWHPITGELWFTDNGRDFLGDDSPPDELNNAPITGLHFGFPYRHGINIKDPEFADNTSEISFTQPSKELGPHVASLGMRFYTGDMFPEEYKNRIFIAEHGSWNRSVPIGYRVTIAYPKPSGDIAYEVFAEGWLQGRSVSGRPVDIEILWDGSLLVSDDYSGTLYRISYNPK